MKYCAIYVHAFGRRFYPFHQLINSLYGSSCLKATMITIMENNIHNTA